MYEKLAKMAGGKKVSYNTYPELFGELEKARIAINNDFPNETLAPVYIIEDSQKLMDLILYHAPSNSEEGEVITVSASYLTKYGARDTSGAIVHEWGHDIHNYNYKNLPARAQKRSFECEADHFAASFGYGEQALNVLKALDRDEGFMGGISDTLERMSLMTPPSKNVRQC